MKTISIDLPYVTRLARNSCYNWMESLRPLRAYIVNNTHRGGCRSCRKAYKSPSPEIIQAIAAEPRFQRDLQQLKKRLRVDRLIVSLGSLRTVI